VNSVFCMCFTDVCDVCAFDTYNNDYLLTYLLISYIPRRSPIPELTGLDVEQLRWSRPAR